MRVAVMQRRGSNPPLIFSNHTIICQLYIYNINHAKVLRNSRYINHIAMTDVRRPCHNRYDPYNECRWKLSIYILDVLQNSENTKHWLPAQPISHQSMTWCDRSALTFIWAPVLILFIHYTLTWSAYITHAAISQTVLFLITFKC